MEQSSQNNRPRDNSRNNEGRHRIEARSYAFLSSWILADILVVYGHSKIAVWLFYFALIIPLGLLTKHASQGWPRWKKFIAWSYVAVFLFVPVFLFFISLLAGFSAMAVATLGGGKDRMAGSLFWCVHTKLNLKRETSPVFVMMYIKFTNDRDSEMVVDGFTMETKSPKGNWERMPIIDVQPEMVSSPSFYALSIPLGEKMIRLEYFKTVRELIFGDTYLQTQFAKKVLSPHESVQGWVMMDLPKDGCTDAYRMKIATGGEILTEALKIIHNVQPERPDGIAGIDILNNKLAIEFHYGNLVDISDIPIRFYSDGLNPNSDVFP